MKVTRATSPVISEVALITVTSTDWLVDICVELVRCKFAPPQKALATKPKRIPRMISMNGSNRQSNPP